MDLIWVVSFGADTDDVISVVCGVFLSCIGCYRRRF